MSIDNNLTIKEWLDTEDQSCVDIVEKKYIQTINGNKETVAEMIQRVAGDNKPMAKFILERYILPAGRIISGRGMWEWGVKCTYSNCYVDPAPLDSIESIYNTCARIARTFSYGGGIGIDISNLAPSGAKVNNSAKQSTGAVSFIETFSNVASTIGQNNRRGALMLSIVDTHPDLPKFITHKRDLNLTQGANMSVRMSDKFFDAVEKDEDWKLSFTRKETGETISKTYKAKDILNIIAETNWDYAEPGVLYWDNICKNNLMSNSPSFQYSGTNPCVTPDTLILTENGYWPISYYENIPVNIWNGYEWSLVTPHVTGLNQPIRTLTFSDGSSITCTDYHKFILANGDRKEAKDLTPADKLAKHEWPVIEGFEELPESVAYTQGFMVGDGCIDNRGRQYIYLYGEKQKLLPFFDYEKFYDYNETEGRYSLLLKNKKIFKYKYWAPAQSYTVKTKLDWLAGYIDSDGTMNEQAGSISITSVNKEFLLKVNLMLNTLGATGVVGLCKPEGQTLLPDGNGGKQYYQTQTSWRLTISAYYVAKLIQLGLRTHRVPLIASSTRNTSHYITITSNIPCGIAPVVYCVNEPKNHSVVFNGIMTGNCAEEPLPGNGACLLASINLANFVIDNDHKKDFCFSQFKGVVKTGIRYLNEIQDENITLHPLPEQRECAKKWRLIGLGFMGLADMFIRMHIRYGSDESLSLIHKIGYTMIFEAFKESVNLAAEFGAFDGCNVDEIESTKFFKKNIEQNPMYSKRDREKLIKNFEEYGLRNAQLLTCAPTGTISTILSISGGIEPLFAISYNRLTKSIYGEDKSYTVHPKCIDELLREGYPMDEIEKLDFVVTARDISWKDRIEVQKAWQEHIDASISSTINLPESATVEEVAEIYKYAHKAGLKGTTIFRENCKRFPILTDNKKKKEDAKVTTEENIAEHKDEKMISKILTRKDLGVVLPGNTYYQKIACGHLYVTVNRYKGKPIEVFMNSSKSGGCSANTEAVGRMASTLLRSNVAPEIVIDTTYGIKCAACSNAKGKGESIDGLSCSDVMARIIKLEWQKYKNGDYDSEKDMEVTPITVAKKNDTPKVVNTNKRADYKNYTADENIAAGYCPECGSRLQMSEGCMICTACGFSKC